jgi:hypothetical protein
LPAESGERESESNNSDTSLARDDMVSEAVAADDTIV